MRSNPDQHLDAALQGDRRALEQLILAVQDQIYNLALRLLWHPDDARDATQDILIRIITHLSDFERRSAFSTWVYRVACNYLLTTRKRRAEMEEVTFELFAAALATGSADRAQFPEPERALLEEEVKIGCTHAMLLCLDRDHRLAYIVGEIVGLRGDEAAAVLDIPPATYRKRLCRARERLAEFLSRNCGAANSAAVCRCAARVEVAIARGRVNRQELLFAGQPRAPEPDIARATSELNALDAAAQLFRSHPQLAAPDSLVASVQALLRTPRLEVLQ